MFGDKVNLLIRMNIVHCHALASLRNPIIDTIVSVGAGVYCLLTVLLASCS